MAKIKKGQVSEWFKSVYSKIKSKLTRKVQIIILTAILVLVAFTCVYKIGKYFTSPKYIASKYIDEIIDNDISGIYNYVDDSEDTFVSEDILKNKMTSLDDVEDYSIISVDYSKKYAYVAFEYESKGNAYVSYVQLKKDGNKLLIYDNWKVESAKVSKNVVFKVLTDSEIEIDDEDVSKYLNKNDNDNNYDTYEIPAMITGTYKITAKLPNGITMDKNITVDTDKTYILAKVDLETDLKYNLQDKVLDNLNSLYKNAVAGKSYSDIKNDYVNDLDSLYKSIKRNISYNNATVKKLVFSEIEIKSVCFNDKGNLELEIIADYDMDYTYTVDNKTINDSKSKYMNLLVELSYENDNFELLDISNSMAVYNRG